MGKRVSPDQLTNVSPETSKKRFLVERLGMRQGFLGGIRFSSRTFLQLTTVHARSECFTALDADVSGTFKLDFLRGAR